MGGWYINPVVSASVSERESAVTEHLRSHDIEPEGTVPFEGPSRLIGAVTAPFCALIGVGRNHRFLRSARQ